MNSVVAYSFDRFAARRTYYSFDFLPKSSDIVYSANTSGQFNVWRQGPPSPEGEPAPAKQLTAFVEWSVRNIAATPDGKTIIAFADKDGDENYQVFKVDPEKGWHQPLVFKPGVRHDSGVRSLSPGGAFIAHGSNERNPMDIDVMLTRVTTGESRPLVAGGGAYIFGHWSSDGNRATVVEARAPQNLDVHIIEVGDGRRRNMTQHDGNEVNLPGPWGISGTGFYLLTNRDREFTGLCFVSAETGERDWIETRDADVDDVALSPDGRTLAWVDNRDGYSFIHLRDVKTGKNLSGPISVDGVITPGALDNHNLLKFSPDGTKLGCIFSTPREPPEYLRV